MKIVKTIYFLSIPVIAGIVILGVSLHISNKKIRLNKEIKDSIAQLLNYQDEVIDIIYTNADLEYNAIQIPTKAPSNVSDSYMETYRENWNNMYGDVIRLFSISNRLSNTLNTEASNNKDVWRLVMISPSDNGISIRFQFPYGFGYKDSESLFGNLFFPNAKEIISNWLDHSLTDPMSEDSNKLQRGKYKSLLNKIRNGDLCNEYYSIQNLSEYMIDDFPYETSALWDDVFLTGKAFEKRYIENPELDMTKSDYGLKKAILQAKGEYYVVDESYTGPVCYPYYQLSNDYFKLYIGTTRPIELQIIEKSKSITADTVQLMVIWFLIGFMLSSIIYFAITKIGNMTNNS